MKKSNINKFSRAVATEIAVCTLEEKYRSCGWNTIKNLYEENDMMCIYDKDHSMSALQIKNKSEIDTCSMTDMTNVKTQV